jgi:hypothetical protein
MSKPSKKKAKKIQKKLKQPRNAIIKDENKLQITSKKIYEIIQKFSPEEFKNIADLIAKPSSDEKTILEKVAEEFILEPQKEEILNVNYSSTDGDYTQYKKHEKISLINYPGTGKQLEQYKAELPMFSPMQNESESKPDFGYVTKKKKPAYQ